MAELVQVGRHGYRLARPRTRTRGGQGYSRLRKYAGLISGGAGIAPGGGRASSRISSHCKSHDHSKRSDHQARLLRQRAGRPDPSPSPIRRCIPHAGLRRRELPPPPSLTIPRTAPEVLQHPEFLPDPVAPLLGDLAGSSRSWCGWRKPSSVLSRSSSCCAALRSASGSAASGRHGPRPRRGGRGAGASSRGSERHQGRRSTSQFSG